MRFLVAAALFLLPAVAFAANFASDPIFLSRTPVTQGDTVRIYAILQDNDTAAFSGSVLMIDGSTVLGSTSLSMASGATQTVSIKWQPSAGSHVITAELIDSGGTITQKQSATFVVQAPPTPQDTSSASAQNASTVESSQGIEQSIGSVSPQARSILAPAFTFVDGARQAVANTIDSQLATAHGNVTSQSPTATTSVGGVSVPNTTSGFFYVLWLAYFYLLTILKFIIDSAAVFYPVVAAIFLYILWRMFRRFRRA